MKQNRWIKRMLHAGIQTLILLVGITFLSFLLSWLSPGDAAERMLKKPGMMVTEEQLEAKREELGIDQPLLVGQRRPPGYAVERMTFQRAVALRHKLPGKHAEALRRAVANGAVEGSVYRYGFPDSAAQQLVNRNVQRLSLEIPHGDVNTRRGSRRDKAASACGNRAVVVQNIFPDKPAPQILYGGHHFKFQPVECCVAKAKNALIGFGNDEHIIRVDGSVYHLCPDVRDPHSFSPFHLRECGECPNSVRRRIL